MTAKAGEGKAAKPADTKTAKTPKADSKKPAESKTAM
jgi:hypothetical protein